MHHWKGARPPTMRPKRKPRLMEKAFRLPYAPLHRTRVISFKRRKPVDMLMPDPYPEAALERKSEVKNLLLFTKYSVHPGMLKCRRESIHQPTGREAVVGKCQRRT